MKTIKLLFVLGTRPEAIKLAPLIQEAKRDPKFQVQVCSTGQHREMIKPIFEFFSITPDIDFDLMKPGQNLNSITSAVLQKLREVILQDRPDWILVQGDTTTTMAGSLCGFYEKVPVAHIEAGLRTGDIASPFPEELNRRITGLIAQLHFPPTEQSEKALLDERVSKSQIQRVGNTGIDALLAVKTQIEGKSSSGSSFFSFLNPAKKLVLVTVHRRESFGEPMRRVFQAIQKLSERKDVEILIPLHMNPEVRKAAAEILKTAKWADKEAKQGEAEIWLVEPLGYIDFVTSMMKSHLIITDSGGVQEEAPSLGKPVLVVRESTERPEGIQAGASVLVGTNTSHILEKANQLLDDQVLYHRMAQTTNPYGDGTASRQILDRLLVASERGEPK